jgi:hypothetical protein
VSWRHIRQLQKSRAQAAVNAILQLLNNNGQNNQPYYVNQYIVALFCNNSLKCRLFDLVRSCRNPKLLICEKSLTCDHSQYHVERLLPAAQRSPNLQQEEFQSRFQAK